jgi:hypothetical protein
LRTVQDAAVQMHRAFHAERVLVERNLCPCASCTATNELKLKFVAHVGEVATQTIKRRRKLIGTDVILVHRLLKNGVPVPEYVLLSEALHSGDGAQELTLELEGFGPVRTFYTDVAALPGSDAPVPEPPALKRLGATLAMVGRGLPYALRVRRAQPAVTS